MFWGILETLEKLKCNRNPQILIKQKEMNDWHFTWFSWENSSLEPPDIPSLVLKEMVSFPSMKSPHNNNMVLVGEVKMEVLEIKTINLNKQRSQTITGFCILNVNWYNNEW